MEAEIVGTCVRCEKTVFCRDGFLDGVVSDTKDLYCYACYEREFPTSPDSQQKETNS